MHPYHLVNASPWPITGATGGFLLVTGLARWQQGYENRIMVIGLIIIAITITQWWRDVVREGVLQGIHTNKVEDGLRLGIILFILSEVFFFISFFWSFFHSSLRPRIDVGSVWPPAGVFAINPFEVPLLNTTLLLSSGATITWAHMSIINEDWYEANTRIVITIILGLLFTYIQTLEYLNTSFSISDSIYGRTFFVATGFHGVHVVIGSIFIFVMWSRHIGSHFSSLHHFGFEASAWYWHFVDVVWLFLYMCVYWWGY